MGLTSPIPIFVMIVYVRLPFFLPFPPLLFEFAFGADLVRD